jgi:hypothetical protein
MYKKFFNSFLVKAFFIILFVTYFSHCQNFTSITAASLEYDGIFGIGWGVFAVIIAIIIGLICCIFGIATIYPGIFVSIGFCLPITIFLIVAFAPLEKPGNLNLKDNPAVNGYILVKWLFFSIMIIAVVALAIPFYGMWSNMLIPQRVDSRAQREYYEKYEKLMGQEKQKVEREKVRQSEIIKNKENNNDGDGEVILPINHNINNNDEAFNENNENNAKDKKKKFLGIGLRRRLQQQQQNNNDINNDNNFNFNEVE